MVTRRSETSLCRARVSVRNFLREKQAYHLKDIAEEALLYTLVCHDWSKVADCFYLHTFSPLHVYKHSSSELGAHIHKNARYGQS